MKLKFHGVCVYVKNHLKESVIRIPDEDSELEIVHLIIEQTTLVCNIFAYYLDVERSDKDKTSRVWHKLIDKVNQAIARGEGTILIGNLNRPLNNARPSFGAKLLNYWI